LADETTASEYGREAPVRAEKSNSMRQKRLPGYMRGCLTRVLDPNYSNLGQTTATCSSFCRELTLKSNITAILGKAVKS
jgi:hypothetical protein